MPDERAGQDGGTAATFAADLCVIGGAGHIGLPFALTCADSGLSTVIYDVDGAKVARIRRGEMPFFEEGAEDLLRRVLPTGRLRVEDHADVIRDCRILVMIIGTPVDEHLNPSFAAIDRVLDRIREQLRDGQVLVLRSTVFPGTAARLQRRLRDAMIFSCGSTWS